MEGLEIPLRKKSRALSAKPNADPLRALDGIIRPKSSPQIKAMIREHQGKADTDKSEAAQHSAWRENRVSQILAELCRRKYEALRLYEPQGFQREFHACTAYERIIRSGVRAGKTLCAAAEFARAATEQDPHGKYPKGRAILVVVGYDQDHIGKVIYPMLFKPGAFKIIRDPDTGRWRSFRPWDHWDRENSRQACPAPPLIPARYIKKRTWVKAGEEIFAVIRLHNGKEIWAYSSRAKPPQGFRADVYWLDEDIDNPEWVDEALARISDTEHGGGRLFWSARPHSKNVALLRMSQRAWEQALTRAENPDIVEVNFDRRLNLHIDQKARDRLSRALRFHGEDVARQMDLGEYTIDEWKVFPELSRTEHEVSVASPEMAGGHLPLDWTRFAVIDPGVAVCAVLFAAVPPLEFGDFVYLEDELYITNCTDEILGRKMAEKISGKSYFAWIIDMHGSVSRQVSGKTIKQQYKEAFERHRIKSQKTGYDFLFGSDNKAARVAMVHRWLAPREDGPPKLRIVEGRLPNFWSEAATYHRKRQRDPTDPSRWIMTDEPDDRGAVHTQVCLQYLAMCKQVRYHEPTRAQSASAGREHGWAKDYLKAKRTRRLAQEGAGVSYVNLGPGRN